MTTIVAIINKNGVSLASDRAWSALWINKVYDTNKLFMLSSKQPIGIAIYELIQFMWIPWEVLIKEYRRKLWNKSFKDINSYKTDFLKYLNSIKTDDQFFEISTIQNFSSLIRRSVDAEITTSELWNKWWKLSHKEITKVVEKHISLLLSDSREKIKAIKPKQWIDNDDIDEFFKKRKAKISQEITDKFSKFWIGQSVVDKILEIFNMHIKYWIYNDAFTGLVISWYWKDELLPSLLEIKVFWKINGKVVYEDCQEHRITHSHNWDIIPFAQKDVVQNITFGLNPKVEFSILDRFTSHLDGIMNTGEEGELWKKQAIKEALVQSIRTGTQAYSKWYVWIANLPLAELGDTAETLVNLTSFRRRVTIEQETVWWKTDVAIISKSDWFIWWKRNHYFDKELNHYYFKNNPWNHE